MLSCKNHLITPQQKVPKNGRHRSARVCAEYLVREVPRSQALMAWHRMPSYTELAQMLSRGEVSMSGAVAPKAKALALTNHTHGGGMSHGQAHMMEPPTAVSVNHGHVGDIRIECTNIFQSCSVLMLFTILFGFGSSSLLFRPPSVLAFV